MHLDTLWLVPDPIEAIDEALGELLRRPNLPRFHAHLTAAAGVDVLERGAMHVMGFVLHHQPVRQGDVADALGVDQSTISRHVARLEDAGLVLRRPDPDDRRVSLLEVSPKGSGRHAALQSARREAIAEVMRDWSRDEQLRLAGDLRRLAGDLAAYTERL